MGEIGGRGKVKSRTFVTGLNVLLNGLVSDALRADLANITASTDGKDSKVPLLIAEFELLPSDATLFRKQIASARRQTDLPPLENAIRLAGVLNAQTHVIALKLAHSLGPKNIPYDSNTGQFGIPPANILSHALRARAFAGEDSRYADRAFAAGIIFDLLFLQANSESIQQPLKKQVLDLISQGFERGLATAKFGLALAKKMKKLTLEEHVIPAALLFEAAEVAAAYSVENHADWIKSRLAVTYPLALRTIDEIELYGVPCSCLGELLAMISPALASAGQAVTEIGSPFALKSSNEKDSHDLAALIRLALELQAKPALLSSTESKRASEIRPELVHLDLEVRGSQVAADLGGGQGKSRKGA